MNKWKQFLLLSLVMAFVLCPLASCKPGNLAGLDTEYDPEIIDPSTIDSTDSYPYAKSLIPLVDFEEQPFRILVCKSVTQFDVNNGDLARNVVATEDLGIAINDAVFQRNTFLQSQLNITIQATQKPFMEVGKELQNAILAQDDRYDICFTRLDDLTPLATGGLLFNLLDMNLSLNEVWWDQNSIDELSIREKLYFAVSDGDIIDKQTTMACMFNKTLMKEQGLDPSDAYDLVLEGDWTIDAMMKMAAGCRKDADGNGVMDANDVWPILTEFDSATCFYYAFGGYVTTKNSADEPVLAMGSGEARLAINKALKDVMLDDYNVYKVERMKGHSGTDTWLAASDMFVNNQAMFRVTNLTTTERWRNMNADFGILPMPKLDEAQRDYIHLCKNGATGVCVPTTNRNLDFTAVCLEAFVSCSRYTLLDAYMETTMEGMVARDERSKEMLKIIFETRAFDLGYIFDFGHDGEKNGTGVGYILKNMAATNSTAFDSKYDSLKDKAQAQIDDMLEKLEKSI